MARKVDWLPAALDDLDAACAFVARESPSYAATLARVVLDKAHELSEFADRGRVVPELRAERLRELFVHRYRLVYRVEETAVVVLAIIHGARDFEQAWETARRQ